MIFIDTSVFYAIVDRDDRAHAAARATWISILSPVGAASLITSNYVLVESFALIQARLGIDAVREFNDAVLPVVVSHWVTEQDHAAAVNAVLTSGRRGLSLVDCSSFQIMRRLGIQRAFAIDRHFREQGFDPLLAIAVEGRSLAPEVVCNRTRFQQTFPTTGLDQGMNRFSSGQFGSNEWEAELRSLGFVPHLNRHYRLQCGLRNLQGRVPTEVHVVTNAAGGVAQDLENLPHLARFYQYSAPDAEWNPG